MKKTRKWVPIHADYFFPERIKFDYFNEEPEKWISKAMKVRKNIFFYIIFEPLKMSLGQLKNGLWKSLWGWQIAAERYVYFVTLYYLILRKSKIAVKL
jgi:hypothetical protein